MKPPRSRIYWLSLCYMAGLLAYLLVSSCFLSSCASTHPEARDAALAARLLSR